MPNFFTKVIMTDALKFTFQPLYLRTFEQFKLRILLQGNQGIGDNESCFKIRKWPDPVVVLFASVRSLITNERNEESKF